MDRTGRGERDDETLEEALRALDPEPAAFEAVDEEDGEDRTGDELDMEVQRIEEAPDADGYRLVTLHTSLGDVICRSYAVEGATRAVIWVGGVGGDFDSPAHALYPRLCLALMENGVASLRVQFRDATDLGDSVLDVLAGLGYLILEGAEALCLVGHSFGGAVMLQAGTASTLVRGVVTLASQSYGAGAAGELPEGCALLAIHGTADAVLPADCSRYIYRLAHQPKRLELLDGAGHGLDKAADRVERAVREFILDRLGAAED